jgi:transcriptional regulator with XRE-family HTH domain
MERKTNGATVRVIRELLGISLTDLAARAGIAKPYMSQIETGVKQPSASVARAIADGMGVALESITYPVAVPEPVAVAS